MDEYFFQKNGLRGLRWCAKYLRDRRSVNNHREQQVFKKTEIVELYWFNSSPNQFDKKPSLTTVDLCKCMNSYFFMNYIFTNKIWIMSENFFCLFFHYWRIVAQRGVSLSGLEVYIATSYIFGFLRTEWEKSNWDINELKYLTSAMDCLPNELNPNLLVSCKAAYLDELKNYYTKHNNK